MRISKIIKILAPGVELSQLAINNDNSTIVDLASDSRRVVLNGLFAAISGNAVDGRDYIGAAVNAGAGVVVLQADKNSLIKLGQTLPQITIALPVSTKCIEGKQAVFIGKASDRKSVVFVFVKDVRSRLAMLASKFYQPQPAHIVGVTGTNGKTSIVDFCRQILHFAAIKSASIGTLGLQLSPAKSAHEFDLSDINKGLTTPDAISLYKQLQRLKLAGFDHIALEASSHGLEQRRLDGLKLAAGAFTNLSRDHLDYHKTMTEYFTAKLRLLELVDKSPKSGFVVDIDSDYGVRFAKAVTDRGLGLVTLSQTASGINGYTANQTNDHRIRYDIEVTAVEQNLDWQLLSLTIKGQTYKVKLPLIGKFQISNSLIALGLTMFMGVDLSVGLDALNHLHSARGRLDLAVRLTNGAGIYVDYAHTPDAVFTALTALRPITDGRLIVVLGAGGDRDPGKRMLMGQAATRVADVVIITDDNPRHECPATIRQMIMAGAPGAIEVADRHEAINMALAMAVENDTVLVAGKGHETGQTIGSTTINYSDYDAIAKAIKR